MSDKYFDADGRCVTVFAESEVYKKSRKYFQLNVNNINKFPIKENYNNLKKFLCSDVDISFKEFEIIINKLKKDLEANDKYKNILNGISVPFILPKNSNDDIGTNIIDKYLPALSKSFKNFYPEFEFKNHCKENIKNQVGIWNNSKYEKIIEKLKDSFVIGLLFPNLNEFSFPAAIETVEKLPENFILAGGYEIISAFVGCPSLLRRDVGYPPLLWFSSLHNLNDDNLCYHLEQYGYNLTFNKRAHLNQAAEYWWHSLVVIG